MMMNKGNYRGHHDLQAAAAAIVQWLVDSLSRLADLLGR